MNSSLFNVNGKDVAKGLVMAVLSGFTLPVIAIIQSPGFNIAEANWESIFVLAINGGIIGFITYLSKNFLSTEDGKFMGVIG